MTLCWKQVRVDYNIQGGEAVTDMPKFPSEFKLKGVVRDIRNLVMLDETYLGSGRTQYFLEDMETVEKEITARKEFVAYLESLEKEFWEIKRYGKFEKGTAKTDSYGLATWFSKFKKVKEAFKVEKG